MLRAYEKEDYEKDLKRLKPLLEKWKEKEFEACRIVAFIERDIMDCEARIKEFEKKLDKVQKNETLHHNKL